MIRKLAALASAAVLVAGPADAQYLTGDAQASGSGLVSVTNNVVSLSPIGAGDIVANNTGSSAVPVDSTLTSIIDQAFSSDQGSILYRSASAWAALAPGSSGTFLETLGAGANPMWASTGASASGCPTATPCTTQQTINDSTANRYGLTLGPSTLGSGTTGHGINIVDTVNDASAVDGVLWFSNTLCTLCTATSYLVDFQVGSVAQFRVSTAGAGIFASNLTSGGSIQAGATGNINWAGRGALTSSTAGDVQFGNADAAAPVAQILSAQSVVAGTSNTAGQDEIFQASRGTGAGAGGAIILKTAPSGTTGTAQNAAIQAGKFDATQYFIPGGTAQPTCGTGCASISAGATDQRMLVTTSTAVISIAVNFSGTKTTAPICTASEIAGTPIAIGFNAAPSTTGFTLTAASALTATVIAVVCL